MKSTCNPLARAVETYEARLLVSDAEFRVDGDGDGEMDDELFDEVANMADLILGDKMACGADDAQPYLDILILEEAKDLTVAASKAVSKLGRRARRAKLDATWREFTEKHRGRTYPSRPVPRRVRRMRLRLARP